MVHCFLWFSVVLNLREIASISYHLAAKGIIWNIFFFASDRPIYLKGFYVKSWNSERLYHSTVFKYMLLFISITSHFITCCATFISVNFQHQNYCCAWRLTSGTKWQTCLFHHKLCKKPLKQLQIRCKFFKEILIL